LLAIKLDNVGMRVTDNPGHKYASAVDQNIQSPEMLVSFANKCCHCDVPATGQIHGAAEDLPYLAVSLTLDPVVISTLLLNEDKCARSHSDSSFEAVRAPAEMIDAWLRMMRLMDRPHEAAVLAPMIEREILFRALQGPLSGVLRDIARPDGRLAQIRRASQWIREHYTEPFRVEPLAVMSEMSVAAFIGISNPSPP